jgi:NADH-quinone oxidoreductase subunit J
MFNKLSIITFWIYLIPLGIFCATAVVFFHNTLYIAFNFLVILIISVIVVFCLKAEFLGYAILIVYIGAIAILFLFVIMMLNLKVNLNNTTFTLLSTWETCITFFLLIKIIIVSKVMLIPNVVAHLGKGLIYSNF